MKALVLDGSREGDSLTAVAVLGMHSALAARGTEVELVKLREVSIAPCTGCFGCWTKTPGVCVIVDSGREAARKVVQSDLIIYLTPSTFGGLGADHIWIDE
jgi:multimeric flavodoxin WrbA